MQAVGSPTGADEARLVAALRAGDEAAFVELLDCHHASLLRVARLYVRAPAVAEEVVQETWAAVIEGLDRFEERSSLKTWIFRILVNRARTRGASEARTVPFSALASADAAAREPAVEPERFLSRDHELTPYQWATPPRGWPEERLLARETIATVGAAIEALPESQREVIRLRDVEGFTAAEVCAALELSEGNQRVLLHRGRAKVRAAIERYLDPEVAT